MDCLPNRVASSPMVAVKRQEIEIEKFHPGTLLSHAHAVTTNRRNFYRTVLIWRISLGILTQFFSEGRIKTFCRCFWLSQSWHAWKSDFFTPLQPAFGYK